MEEEEDVVAVEVVAVEEVEEKELFVHHLYKKIDIFYLKILLIINNNKIIMTDTRRLNKELNDIKKNNIPNISVGLSNKDNLFEWEAVIIGPTETPYENGIFRLDISIPSNYPFKAPIVIFKTKIYHPNINSAGNICLDILKGQWSAALTISKVLLSVCSLLSDPNPNDPLVSDIANVYNTNRELYDKTAKEWTTIYATGA
jgi:ubiquitin-conjugating enzyme E2 D